MKKKKYIKYSAVYLLSILLCFNCFAAIVSDNDGSAFVTKAEFESLKMNFGKQITDYNASIDGKIDGAIASYLAGLKVNTLYYLTFLLEDAAYERSRTFREAWQEMDGGVWNKRFRGKSWCMKRYHLNTGVPDDTFYATKLKISNNASWDGGGMYFNSGKFTSGVWSNYNNNYIWMLEAYDAVDHITDTTRMYVPNNAHQKNYWIDMEWTGYSYSYGDYSTENSRKTAVYHNYTGSMPGFISEEQYIGASTKVTNNLYSVQKWSDRSTTDDFASSKAINDNTMYMSGGKVSNNNIICFAESKMNDWNTQLFSNELAMNGGNGEKADGEAGGSGWPGCNGGDISVFVHFYWSSNGPKLRTLKQSELLVYDLTGLVGESVYYYSGIPVCKVESPGVLKLNGEINYGGKTSYADKKTSIGFNSKKFENYAWSDSYSGGLYKDKIDYFIDSTSDTTFSVTIDYSKKPASEFPFVLWMKMTPNHGTTGTAKNDLLTVTPKFTRIQLEVEN